MDSNIRKKQGCLCVLTKVNKDRGRFYVLTKVCILDMIFAGDKLCQDKHAKKAKAEYIRRHRTVPCLPNRPLSPCRNTVIGDFCVYKCSIMCIERYLCVRINLLHCSKKKQCVNRRFPYLSPYYRIFASSYLRPNQRLCFRKY